MKFHEVKYNTHAAAEKNLFREISRQIICFVFRKGGDPTTRCSQSYASRREEWRRFA